MSAVPWYRPLMALLRASPNDCNVSDTVSRRLVATDSNRCKAESGRAPREHRRQVGADPIHIPAEHCSAAN